MTYMIAKTRVQRGKVLEGPAVLVAITAQNNGTTPAEVIFRAPKAGRKQAENVFLTFRLAPRSVFRSDYGITLSWGDTIVAELKPKNADVEVQMTYSEPVQSEGDKLRSAVRRATR